MDLKENLLTTVSEECAEIQQAVSKILRFGDSHFNKDHAMVEFYQLCAVVEMCQGKDILPRLPSEIQDEIKSKKKQKVRHYQEFSRQIGTLCEEDDTNA